MITKRSVLAHRQGSPIRVVKHARWKAKRGRRPSLPSAFMGIRNPMMAVALAQKMNAAASAGDAISIVQEFWAGMERRAQERRARDERNRARHQANLANGDAMREIDSEKEPEPAEFKNGFEELLRIAKLAAKHSGGHLRISYREEHRSKRRAKDAGHFLKLDGKSIGHDIETYSIVFPKRGWKPALAWFSRDVLFLIEKRLPKAYEKATEALRGLGMK